MLRNLTFVVYNLHILASDQKTFLFFRATFEQLSLQKATFDFWATFWEITGNFLEILEQLVESLNCIYLLGKGLSSGLVGYNWND